jgi:hypothetical protein
MKKMPKKRHLLYYRSTFAIFVFLIILALNMRVLWMSAILVFVFGSGIAIPTYWKYHYGQSGKKEKERMIAQKQINSYNYNRWYTPADSTEMEHQIELKKEKKVPSLELLLKKLGY